jgi:hypothetical protein
MIAENDCYVYYTPDLDHVIMCGDDAKFCNHDCFNSNIAYEDDLHTDAYKSIASKDIYPGEEFLDCYCLYSEIDKIFTQEFMGCEIDCTPERRKTKQVPIKLRTKLGKELEKIRKVPTWIMVTCFMLCFVLMLLLPVGN